MSHNVGRVVPLGTRIGPDSGAPATVPGMWQFDFTPGPAPLGGSPRFVMLHFNAMSFPGSARLEVDLRYDTDRFDATDGADAWSRPIDPLPGPIAIRYFGSGPSGGVTLAEYGSGEPTITGTPGTFVGSRTNPDIFLHTNPYVEPIYETRLQCGPFDWLNAAAAAPGSIAEQCARAVCMIIAVHEDHVSTCSATLIGPDLVLTAFHCMSNPGDLEARSGSVTFDYATTAAGGRPAGYAPRFHKIKRTVRRGSSDWLVFQIETPSGGLGIAPRELRAAAPMAGETVFALHHPNGAVKKLQTRTLEAASVTPVGGFDFAGGSSGSPLFDASGRILGAALSVGPVGDSCHASYVPASTARAELANPPAPPTPFDIMLVMDRSGSMSSPGTSGPGRTKMVEAREAASLFVQLLRLGAGDRVGMVAFSTAANRPPDSALEAVTATKKGELVGPAPYSGGRVGLLTPDGMTSIGDGIKAAMESLGSGGANRRAILLMTDGLQNTAPMIAEAEPMLGNTQLCVVGFGSEDQLNGPLLTSVARDHGGIYTRASNGLELKKFFGLCFGNIFEAGTLTDPGLVLRASETSTDPAPFDVCDEERITAIVGWDDPSQALAIRLITPTGQVLDEAVPGLHADSGATWHFLRIPLPHNGERDGSWRWSVVRRGGGGEFPPPAKDVAYFISIIADGGPRLEPLPFERRVYTGDAIVPRAALRYPDGTSPHAHIEMTVDAPEVALGALAAKAGLARPVIDGDAVDALHATLQGLAQGPAGLVIPTRPVEATLRNDDPEVGATLEPGWVYGAVLRELTRNEGTYTFHARARYGHGCVSTREAIWSVYVECGIDPNHTRVDILSTTDGAGGLRLGRIRVRPQDRYGNPLGPGRADQFDVAGATGSRPTGPVRDMGDGNYEVDVEWDPTVSGQPGLVVSQPDRAPVTIAPTGAAGGATGCPRWLCMILALLLFIAVLMILILLFA